MQTPGNSYTCIIFDFLLWYHTLIDTYMDTNKFGAYTAHTMARLFGTNGIRGVFGEDMSLQFAHDITLSLAAHIGKGPVLVARYAHSLA